MSELHVIFGTGPLGRFTAEALRAEGRPVRLVNRSGTLAEAPAGAELVKADLLDPAQAAAAVTGATTVYQCAQPEYHRWAEEFPAIQHAVLTAAERVQARLVVAENLYMYGNTGGVPMTESTPYTPCSKKGEVRRALTETLFAAHAAGRLRVSAVRGSDFFGPWEPINGGMVFRSARNGKPVSLVGRLDQPHTFTYVKDFGRALAVAGTRDQALGRAWHVPSGPPLTQRELVQLVQAALGRPVRAQVAGAFLLGIFGLFSPGAKEMVEMLYEFTGPFVMDSSAMESAFGLKPTPYDQRVRETLAWVERG